MPALSPEDIARLRQRYLDGEPVAAIRADLGVSHRRFYRCLDGKPDGQGPALPAIPRRRVMVGGKRKRQNRSRAATVKRLWRAAERQVRDIEDRLRLNQQQPDERERDARVLAITVKTLRELRALQDAEEETREDDKAPADLDDFRRELARKIDGIIARRTVPTARAL